MVTRVAAAFGGGSNERKKQLKSMNTTFNPIPSPYAVQLDRVPKCNCMNCMNEK